MVNNIIKTLMDYYRKSRFHSAKNGRILANILSFYIKAKRQGPVVKEIKGVLFELDLSQVIDSSLYFTNTYEPKNEAIMEKFLKADMHVLDIGANIGLHTFHMAKLVSPSGFVNAIEPTNWAYQKLMKNLSLNPLINNVGIDQIALSDENLGIQEIGFTSSYRLDNRVDNQIEKTMIMKLDEYVFQKNISKIDFIKLDVDGYEGKIFEGGKETIIKFHPMILFEINPLDMRKTGISAEQVFIFLLDNQYKLFDDNLSQFNQSVVLHQKENQSIMVFAHPNSENIY